MAYRKISYSDTAVAIDKALESLALAKEALNEALNTAGLVTSEPIKDAMYDIATMQHAIYRLRTSIAGQPSSKAAA